MIKQSNGKPHRSVSLHTLTIGTNPWQYLRYRLRYVFFSSGLGFVFQCIEFLLVMRFFMINHAISYFSIRILSTFIRQMWWVYLENLRQQVREAAAKKVKKLIPGFVFRYIYLAITIGVVLLIVLAFIVYFQPTSKFSWWFVFPAVVIVQLVLMMMASTIHSACLAIRRVYRPFWSIIAPEAIRSISIIAAWFIIGAYGLLFALVAGALTSSYLMWYFSHQTWQQLKFPGLHWLWPKDLQKDATHRHNKWTLIGVGLVFGFEAVIILSLLIQSLFEKSFSLIGFLYIIFPVLISSAAWYRIFYYDYQKLNRLLFRHLLLRTQKYTYYMGIYASVLALLLLTWVAWYFDFLTLQFLLPLTVFVVLRVYLSIRYLVFFCWHNYAPILISGLILLLCCLPLYYYSDSLIDIMIILSIAEILAFIPMLLSPKKDRDFFDNFFAFDVLKSLAVTDQPVACVELARVNNFPQTEMMLRRTGFSRTLFFQPKTATGFAFRPTYFSKQRHKQWLHNAIRRLKQEVNDASMLLTSQQLTAELHKLALQNDKALQGSNALLHDFVRDFPTGLYIDLKTHQHIGKLKLSTEEWHSVFIAMTNYARNPVARNTHLSFFVCSLIDMEKFRYIFIVPADIDNRSDWYQLTASVTQANWQQMLDASASGK